MAASVCAAGGAAPVTRGLRQRDDHVAALRLAALGADRAAVQLDDPARDRQPEARPAAVGAAAPVAAVKALEHAVQLIRRDARAVVVDLDRHDVVERRTRAAPPHPAAASSAPRSRRGS